MLKHSDLAYGRLAEAWLGEVQLFSSRGFFLGILESTSTCREKKKKASLLIFHLRSHFYCHHQSASLTITYVRRYGLPAGFGGFLRGGRLAACSTRIL